MDNLDRQRCRPETEDIILDQLHRHGLVPDGPVIRQSERLARYRQELDRLRVGQHIYRCSCSRNVLREGMLNGMVRDGLAGPIYPGTCRERPPAIDQIAGWRFSVPECVVEVPDRRLGGLSQRLTDTIGDPLLQRSDGVFAYHLAEVVDNADYMVTDVVRGADLAPLTPLHQAVHEALYPGQIPPRYLHLPVLNDATGRKLSKTNRAPPLDGRRAPDNLIRAARVLGLSNEHPTDDLAGLLGNWTDQWRRSVVAGQQPIDPLEAPRQ